MRPVIKLCNWSLKELLGVRRSTSNIVCFAEAAYPSLPDLVRAKQAKLKSLIGQISHLDDDPFMLVLNIVRDASAVTTRLTGDLLSNGVADVMQATINEITRSDSSRCLLNKNINQNLVAHSIYRESLVISEIDRISFTRFQVHVLGHGLYCETGLWNKRGHAAYPWRSVCVWGGQGLDREECRKGLPHDTRTQNVARFHCN